MRKIRLLQDYLTFNKNSYRVIMAEDNAYIYVQENLHRSDQFRFNKSDNGVIFVVVERS